MNIFSLFVLKKACEKVFYKKCLERDGYFKMKEMKRREDCFFYDKYNIKNCTEHIDDEIIVKENESLPKFLLLNSFFILYRYLSIITNIPEIYFIDYRCMYLISYMRKKHFLQRFYQCKI